MASEHLPQEEIELLSRYELRGKAFAEALSHLEVCGECRSKIKSPTKQEIINRLLPDEDDPEPPGEDVEPEETEEIGELEIEESDNKG